MTTKNKTSHVTIDLSDVVAAGGVAEAIHAACCRSELYASGYTQSAESHSTFSCQWHEGLGRKGYARRFIEGGALHYIDHSDGRMISAIEVEEVADGEWETKDGESVDADDVINDYGGGHSVLGDWSDDSVVCLACPEIDEALEHPAEVAEMAQAVIDTHGPESDRKEWAKLIRAIHHAAEALEGIDADDLEG